MQNLTTYARRLTEQAILYKIVHAQLESPDPNPLYAKYAQEIVKDLLAIAANIPTDNMITQADLLRAVEASHPNDMITSNLTDTDTLQIRTEAALLFDYAALYSAVQNTLITDPQYADYEGKLSQLILIKAANINWYEALTAEEIKTRIDAAMSAEYDHFI